MIERLTTANAKDWHMREEQHHNGGAEFFAYLHRCIEQPRLSRFDRYDRKTRGVTSTWRADGVDHETMESAIEALNTAPVFDADELAFLATVPDEFADIREGIDWIVNDRVRNKGAVEWEKGRCRRTDLGRSVLAGGAGAVS